MFPIAHLSHDWRYYGVFFSSAVSKWCAMALMYPFTATHTISLVGLELLVHLYISVNRNWAFVNAEYFICNCLLTDNYQNYEQKCKCSPLCMIPYMCQHETDSKETKISKAKEILQERHNQLN